MQSRLRMCKSSKSEDNKNTLSYLWHMSKYWVYFRRHSNPFFFQGLRLQFYVLDRIWTSIFVEEISHNSFHQVTGSEIAKDLLMLEVKMFITWTCGTKRLINFLVSHSWRKFFCHIMDFGVWEGCHFELKTVPLQSPHPPGRQERQNRMIACNYLMPLSF